MTQSRLFKTKTTTIQNGDFVTIWRGFPNPSQKDHKKSPITKKGLFQEKIVCLKKCYINILENPDFRGEGGGWDKIQTLLENDFEGLLTEYVLKV